MKTYFIIQGHTKYCSDVLDSFKGSNNIIWCTDIDSPEKDLEAIRNSNVQLITIPKRERVLHNINIHIESSLVGLKEAKKNGAEMAVKLRSDMSISDIDQFIKNMNNDGKMYGNNYVRHNQQVKPQAHMVSNTTDWLIRNCKNIVDLCNHNYITDWIYYSDIDTMIYFYENCKTTEFNLDIIEEHRFIGSYLTALGKPISFDLDYLKKYFGIFMGTMKKNNVDVLSLKEKLNYSKLDEILPVYIGE